MAATQKVSPVPGSLDDSQVMDDCWRPQLEEDLLDDPIELIEDGKSSKGISSSLQALKNPSRSSRHLHRSPDRTESRGCSFKRVTVGVFRDK